MSTRTAVEGMMTNDLLTLRQHRARRILTMKQLAEKAEVGTQSIVRIERGEYLRPSVYGKIAKALEVQPEEIREFVQMVHNTDTPPAPDPERD